MEDNTDRQTSSVDALGTVVELVVNATPVETELYSSLEGRAHECTVKRYCARKDAGVDEGPWCN